MGPSPALPVVVPLLAAALLAGLRPWLRRWAVDLIALLTAGVTLTLNLTMVAHTLKSNIVYWFGDWFPRGRLALGIGFEVDPVGAGVASLGAFLVLLAFIYSWRSMESGNNLYQPLMLIFLAAICGFALTCDLFNMFVFFELMSIAAFALCGLKTAEPAPLQGAFNFAVTNTVGAFLILTGIAFLYSVTGALNMAQMGWLLGSRHDSLVTVAAAFLISGFLIKGAIAPFHFWLPDAHSVAPTPVCVIFSGLMVELGLFAVLRITSTVFGQSMALPDSGLRNTLLLLGSLTVVWGGLMCFAEHHLKRLLAFSTISHAGAMLLGVAIGSPLAVTGWLIYLFAHAMAKAGLFFVSGILLHRLGGTSEPTLFGRGKPLPFTGLLWLLGGTALAGLLPFGIGQGEDLIGAATHSRSLAIWLSLMFLLSGALTAAAVFRVFFRVFMGWGDRGPSDRAAKVGEKPESIDGNPAISAHLFVPACVCIAFAALPFVVPRVAGLILPFSARFVSQSAYISAVYGEAAPIPAVSSSAPEIAIASVLLHGMAAAMCALLLACAAVFHRSIPRTLRLASYLEGSRFALRKLQSGHPGDYVVWCMVGFVVVGGSLFLLR